MHETRPEGEAPEYGIDKPVGSANPLWIQVHEYVAIAREARPDGGHASAHS